MTHRIAFPLSLVILTALAAPAAADKPAQRAEVELVESSASGSKSVVFTVALADDEAPSTVSARTATASYELKLWRTVKPKSGPVLSLELSRHDAKGPGAVSVRGTTRAAVGERATVLQVDRGDGTRYEVAVTLR